MQKKYAEILGQQGRLAKKLASYEYRPGQMEMAEAIAQIIDVNGQIMVEGGTGVGKSFAYLIPLLEWSVKQGNRVVVTTHTKALQEQLAKKDLPFLQKVLDLDFKYALCFGAENYLCLRRAQRSWQRGLFESSLEATEFEKLMEWADQTKTGLKTELYFEPHLSTWLKLCRERDLCRGRHCKNFEECFYTKARKQQQEANLLIANHHLFFANLASGKQVLPSFEGVVFDEAHNLEEVAAAHLGFELTNNQLKYLLDEFANQRYKTGFLHTIKELRENPELAVLLNASRQAADVFFNSVQEILGNTATLRLQSSGQLADTLAATIEQFVEAVNDHTQDIEDGEDQEELSLRLLRLQTWAETCTEFCQQKRGDHVYWLEAQARARNLKYLLCASPIDVAPYLKELLFKESHPLVLTSATITVNNSFDYLKQRLGIDHAYGLIISSPFDFAKQTLLYTPDGLPDPAYNEIDYVEAISNQIEGLTHVTQGRSFVLFTSYKMLNMVYENLRDKLGDFNLLKQGDISRWQMLEQFKKAQRAVLFGTASFWQGVDVPGEALESVIITRLPFAVPNHPLVEARIASITEKGGNAFLAYQIPQAVLLFRQGVGRLIRHRQDLGIVSILDPRVKTRNYGKYFLNSIPVCQTITDIEKLAQSYQNLRNLK
ncbi:MAG: helicase C-terminal domain-containing protein [Pseudomonadota bacterium]